ncbi:HAD family hydrolase [Anaerorhabdus sp.]|uniref:HAD family hydrolase n=1 Tax=Anaerorhabdus sp. TaxID=1872524 RepID=UPI002B217100|nr:HAD family phosphatase [Anaerorhabdus sp.]MEA4874471.1 HAD family phosphatase [Anaerorhabdus sp.]
MKKIIIFDMDGVLIDSEPVYYERQREFLQYKKFDFSEELLDSMVGNTGEKTFQLFKEEIPGFYQIKEEFTEEKRIYFKDRPVNYKAIINQNAKEIITWLKSEGWSISIASSSPLDHILKIVKLIEIEEFLDYIVSGEDFVESKPNPEIYNHVASLYQADSKECIAVEDSTFGIEAALKSGMKVICKIDTRYGINQDGADVYIDNLIEIKDKVYKLF